MNPDFLDRYASLDSPVHRVDARVKVLVVLVCLGAWVTIPQGQLLSFAPAVVFLAFAWAVSRLPAGFLASRTLPVVAFVAVMAVLVPFRPGGRELLRLAPGIAVSSQGLERYLAVLGKAFTSVTAVALLSATTSFATLLEALERLRAPRTLVLIISFAYRYLFVIAEETLRMKRARDARLFGGRWLWHSRVIGQMVGTLFLHSYERAERVYQAMVARGYHSGGTPLRPAALSRRDVAILAVAPVLVVGARLVTALAAGRP